MAETAPITRYDKVKQILDHADASCATDYDGQGQFWNLPLEQSKACVVQLRSTALNLPRVRAAKMD